MRGLAPPRVRSVGAIVAAQVVNLGATLLITRLYAPESFGRFATLLALAAVVGGVSSLRLEIAATTASDADAPVLLRTALRFNLVVGGCVGIVAVAWNVAVAGHLVEGLLLGAVTATFGASTTLMYARVRQRRYGLVAAAKLLAAVVQAVAQVGLAFGVPTTAALLGASALGYGAGAALQARGGARPATGARAAADSDPRDVLTRHRGFMVASAPAALVNALAMNAPIFATALVGGAVATAHLALALRIGALPAALFGQALAPILFGEIAHQLRDAPAAALRSYDRALGVLSATGAVALTALAVVVYAVAPRLLGPEYAGAGPLMLLLLPFTISQFAVAPLTQTLNATGRNGEQFAWDVGRLALVVAAFAPAVAGWSGLNTVVLLFSVLMVAAYAGHVLLARNALRTAAARQPTIERSEREHARA